MTREDRGLPGHSARDYAATGAPVPPRTLQTTEPSRPSSPTLSAIGSTCAVTVPATFASTGPADALSSVHPRADGAAVSRAPITSSSAAMRMLNPPLRLTAFDVPMNDRAAAQNLQRISGQARDRPV